MESWSFDNSSNKKIVARYGMVFLRENLIKEYLNKEKKAFESNKIEYYRFLTLIYVPVHTSFDIRCSDSHCTLHQIDDQ